MFGILPPDSERCVKIKRNGERCSNRRMTGLTVCQVPQHGFALPALRAQHEKAKILMGMQKLVTPIESDDLEADPIYGFEMEYRRTVARIRYFDEQLSLLQDKDLIWGQSKLESINATEFPGVNVTYEAKVNVLYKLQMEERTHLIKMQKIWISAKLDIRKLEIEDEKVRALDQVITATLTQLGLNAKSPEVRNVVRSNLLSLMPGEPIKKARQ